MDFHPAVDFQAPQPLNWKGKKTPPMKSYDPSMEKYLCHRDDLFCGVFTLFYRDMSVGLYIYSSNYMLHGALRKKKKKKHAKNNSNKY